MIIKIKKVSQYCFSVLILTITLCYVLPAYGQQSLSDTPEQKKEDYDIFISCDVIYWKSRKPDAFYAVDQTPLKTIPGYDTLYKKATPTFCPPDLIPTPEKPYSITWEIIDKQLYLCDIVFDVLRGWGEIDLPTKDTKEMRKYTDDAFFPNGAKYQIMEQFTGIKFQKDRIHTAWPIKPQGVIPALWVNGSFLLKKNETKIPVILEPELTTGYRLAINNAPTIKVTFSKGRIVSVEHLKKSK